MLSDLSIRLRLEGKHDDGSLGAGKLSIDPLIGVGIDAHDADAIQGCAVDLRLGTWFEVPRLHSRAAFDLHEPRGGASDAGRFRRSVFVPFGQEFVLHPGSFALAVTLEWLRLPADLAGAVAGKSSWGRRGLAIATATTIHPYFVGCLTLEMANLGAHPITLKPGVRICQLSLTRLTMDASAPLVPSRLIGHRRPVSVQVVLDARAAALDRASDA